MKNILYILLFIASVGYSQTPITDDNIGILTINSFGLNGWKRLTIDYKAFLEEIFTQLKTEKVNHVFK